MTSTPAQDGQRPVAVGFDGTDRSVAALEYAVAEAAQRHAPLRVIHVAPLYPPTLPERAGLDSEIDSMRRAAEASVALRVHRVATGIDVDLRHRAGSPSRVLLVESAGAQLVVLGREHKSRLDRAVTGATTAAVASRAPVPTVVVPAGWTRGRRARPVVVVGLKQRGYADALFDAAFEHAARTDAEVRVVEAERYADDAEDRAIASASAALVAGWREAYPDVRVRLELVEEDGADALVRASRDADLLFVLRRTSAVLPAHLGGVTRAVVQHASCPVEVVPAADTVALLELERDGALLR